MASPVLLIVLGCAVVACTYLWWRFGRSLDQIPGGSTGFARYVDWQATRLIPVTLCIVGLLIVLIGIVRLLT